MCVNEGKTVMVRECVPRNAREMNAVDDIRSSIACACVQLYAMRPPLVLAGRLEQKPSISEMDITTVAVDASKLIEQRL